MSLPAAPFLPAWRAWARPADSPLRVGAMSPERPPVHIITFVTRTGRACYFAVQGDVLPDGTMAPVKLPPHVRAQLDAIGARVAWWYLATNGGFRVAGEACEDRAPVMSAKPEEYGRLVFL